MRNTIIIIRPALICILFFVSNFLHAQNIQRKEDITIGKNLITLNSITGKVYEFNGERPNIFIDSLHNYMFIKSRGISGKGKYLSNKGHIYMLDLNNGTELWSRGINYFSESISYTSKGILIGTKGIKNSLIDLKTGEEIWNKKFSPAGITNNNQVLLTYKNSKMYGITNKLEGREISTGEVIWETEIEHNYGWNRLLNLNDSTLLIFSSGLHSININDGSGWDYKAKTGIDDYKGTVAVNTIGVLSTILLGVGFMQTGHDMVTGLVSNILIKDSIIYMANHETIACINLAGDIIWETELPDKSGAASLIYLKDDKLYMINYGTGKCGQRLVNVGYPFMACFDKNNGNTVFFNQLTEKKHHIEDILKTDNTLILIYNDGIDYGTPYNYAFKSISWDTKNKRTT